MCEQGRQPRSRLFLSVKRALLLRPDGIAPAHVLVQVTSHDLYRAVPSLGLRPRGRLSSHLLRPSAPNSLSLLYKMLATQLSVVFAFLGLVSALPLAPSSQLSKRAIPTPVSASTARYYLTQREFGFGSSKKLISDDSCSHRYAPVERACLRPVPLPALDRVGWMQHSRDGPQA